MSLLDRPIERPDQDRLGHSELAERIARHIQMFPPDHVDMIGVFGSWGSGKSGLLNLVHAQLDETFRWIYLDALRQPDGDILLPLLTQLAQDDRRAKKSLSRLAVWLSVSFTDFVIGRLTSGKNVKELKKTYDRFTDLDGTVPESPHDNLRAWFDKLITRLTSGTVKRVVLTVDNADRCRPEVVLRAIETLHTVTECSSCTFLFAVDHKILEQYINKRYEGGVLDGTQYLEKMFPESFAIPEPRTLDRYSEGQTSGDDVLEYIRDLLREPECENIRSREKVLWSAFRSTSRLRNPRHMKGLIRRCCRLEGTLDEETFEYCLILVILHDLWPKAVEILRTADQTYWEDYVSGPSSGASDDPTLLEFAQGMGVTGRIYDVLTLRKHLDHVARLGL